MSLVTDKLTKNFGDQIAVNEVSFSLQKGEIVGFLGPNGAGKSTTMKMITGYIQPTSGHAEIEGTSVTKNPLKVKKTVGYLPEHNPLYTDLYVKEYLRFVAGLHGLSDVNERVNAVIVLTGLEREQHKQIRQLSKGFRQRVGLAQAIIHDPDVLILDEPTSGLDPNQLKEIRQLIKDISKNKIVLFSSHILQEVEALCDRIILIDKGTIVADCPLNEFHALSRGRLVLEVEFEKEVDQSDLQDFIKQIDHLEQVDQNKLFITPKGDFDIRRSIFNFAKTQDNAILGLKKHESSLESIFSSLTNSN